MRVDLSQIALKIIPLPIQNSLIQLIPKLRRFCEFRKDAFHDTTLYVYVYLCIRTKYMSSINEVQHQSVFVENFNPELSLVSRVRFM